MTVEQSRIVRLILGKKQLRLTSRKEPALAVLPVLQLGGEDSVHGRRSANHRAAQIHSPGPGIAKPKCG